MPKSICPHCFRIIEKYCSYCGKVVPTHPDGMVPLPSGGLIIGTTTEHRSVLEMMRGTDGDELSFENEKPLRVILRRPCYIDRYPVTVTRFANFLSSLSPVERRALGLELEIDLDSLDPDLPATGVPWHAAVRYAASYKKRLPTEAEWEAAAGWDPESHKKRIFPWGDDFDIGDPKCNREGKIQGVRTFEIVGSSPIGCCDMVGNVHEWLADPFEEKYRFRTYEELGISPHDKASSVPRTIRGGSCKSGIDECRVSWRSWSEPWNRGSLIGFRCVMDV